MVCPFCRCLAWLQHKLDVRAQQKAARARDAARTERIERGRSASLGRRRREPPPTPLPPPGDTETLEVLRARVSPRSRLVDEENIFIPPPPTDTMEQACREAAFAVEYPITMAITEPERELVAAQAVRAIATAVSTSPCRPVLVAALTMAESRALIYAENPYRSRHYTAEPPGIEERRRLNAFNTAVEAGMAAHAEDIAQAEENQWRPDDYDTNGPAPPAYTDCVSGYMPSSTGIHATQPGRDPQEDPYTYQDSLPLLHHSHSTQSPADHSLPGPEAQENPYTYSDSWPLLNHSHPTQSPVDHSLPGPEPQENPDPYSDSWPLLNRSYPTRYSENHNRPGSLRQRPTLARQTEA